MSIAEAFNGLINTVISWLPLSPFAPIIEEMQEMPYISYVNWLFPVGECLNVLSAWLVAYAGYLIYSVIARWVKVIGD